jgi:hypothetical protein
MVSRGDSSASPGTFKAAIKVFPIASIFILNFRKSRRMDKVAVIGLSCLQKPFDRFQPKESNMRKADGRVNQEVRQICRDINSRADDPEKLQTLVIRLQEVLRHERYDTRTVKFIAQPDDPFDKIMVG